MVQRIIRWRLALIFDQTRQRNWCKPARACDQAWRSRCFCYRTLKELLKRLERSSATQQVLEFIEVHPVIRPIAESAVFIKHAIQGG